MTKTELMMGRRPRRPLTAKEGRWVDELDRTPYVVCTPPNPARGWCETRSRVIGYTSARVVAGRDPGAVIMTEAEARRLLEPGRPYFS